MNYGESGGGVTMPTAGDGEVYSLKWHTFQSHYTDGLKSLFLETDPLTDVTLASEGRYLRTHKLILSLCSPYFKHMFQVNQSLNGNMIVVLNNVKFTDLENLLHFIYSGEVKVKNTDLNGFLQAGELLQIEGLANCGANDESQSSSIPDQSEINSQSMRGSLNNLNQNRPVDDVEFLPSQSIHNSVPSNPVRVQMSASHSSSFPMRIHPHHKSAQRSVKRAKYTVQSTGRSVGSRGAASMSNSGYGQSSVPNTDPLEMIHQNEVISEEINPLLDDPLSDDHMIQIDTIKSEGVRLMRQQYLNENPDEYETSEPGGIGDVGVGDGDIFTTSLTVSDGASSSLPGPSSAITGRTRGLSSTGATSKPPDVNVELPLQRTNWGGRIASMVWDSFTYNQQLNKSVCKLCGFHLAGKNSTNLRKHLRFKHQLIR